MADFLVSVNQNQVSCKNPIYECRLTPGNRHLYFKGPYGEGLDGPQRWHRFCFEV